MKSIIHAISLPMIIIIGFLIYCLMQYADGNDSLSKANSVCKMNYDIGNWMDKDLFSKFDPAVGSWANHAWQFVGDGCFYIVSHVNSGLDSKIKWDDTQLYNVNKNNEKQSTNQNGQSNAISNFKADDSNVQQHIIDEGE